MIAVIRSSRLLFLLGLLLAPLLSGAETIPRGDYKFSVAAIFAEGVRYNGEVEPSAGTGFLISERGEILTALHVVGDPELYESINVNVYFPKRHAHHNWTAVGPYKARIKAVLPEYDLVLLALDDISYASTLPVLGFDFVDGLQDGVELDGYAFNLLNAPETAGQPARVWGRVSRDALVPPYSEVGQSSLNIGGSGGPILERGDRVAAVWHGAVVTYEARSGEVKSVNGTAWVIPMTNVVNDWLVSSGISPRRTAAERPVLPSIDREGFAVVHVAARDLELTKPDDPTSSMRFASAPLGTEIVDARLIQDIVHWKCHLMKCSRSISTQVIPLNIVGRTVALLQHDPEGNSRVQLKIRALPATPNVDVRYVNVERVPDSRNGIPDVLRIDATPGQTILAATYVGHDQSQKTPDLRAVVDDDSLVVRHRKIGPFRVGFMTVEASSTSSPNAPIGQVAILEGEDGAKVGKQALANLVEQAAIAAIPSEGQDGVSTADAKTQLLYSAPTPKN